MKQTEITPMTILCILAIVGLLMLVLIGIKPPYVSDSTYERVPTAFQYKKILKAHGRIEIKGESLYYYDSDDNLNGEEDRATSGLVAYYRVFIVQH